MTNNIAKLQEDAEAAQALLQAAKDAIAKQESTKSLATDLHKNFCKKSHEDGFCAWDFEIEYNKDEDPWDGRSHQYELKRAVDLVAKFPNVPTEDIVGIMLEAKRFTK